MKKSLIALAVAAGSIAAAQADTTTLYGSIGFGSTFAKTEIDTSGKIFKDVGGSIDDTFKSIKENHWGVDQTRARLGVKGTEDLSNGLQATFKYELENKGGPEAGLGGTRDAYVGLKGDFGEVRIGRQGNTWNTDEDYFENGPAKGVEKLGRSNSTIKYIAPDYSGFSFAARVVADKGNPASKGADAWDVSLGYKANGLFSGVSYSKQLASALNVSDVRAGAATGITGNGDLVYPVGKVITGYRDNGSNEALGLQVGYENDQFGVFGNVQHEASANTVYNLQGKYMFDANQLRGGVGFTDAKDGNNEIAYGLGYQYNLSNRTYTWVEGVYNTIDNGSNDFTASVGIRHDF